MKILKRAMLLLTFLMLASCIKEDSLLNELEATTLKSSRNIGVSELPSILLNTSSRKKWKKDITAYFDPSKRTFTALVPEGTDVSSLLPKFGPGTNTQFTPQEPQDFTRPVMYSIKVNGKFEKYTVEVKVGYNDYDVLKTIHFANPGNKLGWEDNLNDSDLSNWEGVHTDLAGNVIYLWMPDSQLTLLPPEIRGLKYLEQLLVSQNSISIPSEIGRLKNLQELWAVKCNLKTLPEEISQLTNMIVLSLASNKIDEIPTGIFHLIQLKHLYLSSNNITTFPEQFFELPKLERLRLGYNDLTKIPNEIGQLSNLSLLSINDNALSTLPIEIVQLEQLEQLDLKNNPLPIIHGSICDLELQGDTEIDIVPGVQCQY